MLTTKYGSSQQTRPSPCQPGLQAHSKPGSVFVQLALRSQSSVPAAHSSTSVHVTPLPSYPSVQVQANPALQAPAAEVEPSPLVAAPPSEVGGKPEAWWRGEIGRLRAEIEDLERQDGGARAEVHRAIGMRGHGGTSGLHGGCLAGLVTSKELDQAA